MMITLAIKFFVDRKSGSEYVKERRMNGWMHRDHNRPAIIYSDGTKEWWYYDGQYIYGRTPEFSDLDSPFIFTPYIPLSVSKVNKK